MKSRPGVVYAAWGYHPMMLLKGKIEICVLYVGQTRQAPENRWHQHEFGSPNGEPAKSWRDTIVRWEAIHTSRISDAALDAAELKAILKHRPLYNIQGNLNNSQQIPPWEAKRLRELRDAAGGTKFLLYRAKALIKTEVGWRIEGNTVIWYGDRAEEVGSKWHKQLMLPSSYWASRLAAPSGTSVKRRRSKSTARAST